MSHSIYPRKRPRGRAGATPFGEPRIQIEAARRLGDIPVGLRKRLADVENFEAGDLGLAGANDRTSQG